MPKRQKRTQEDKILDCERPPPGLTLASFLDAQLAKKTVPQEDATADADEVPQDDNDDTAAAATAQPSQPERLFIIRRNKKGSLPLSYESRSKGKKVTVIANVTGDASSLVSELKRLTGTGGVQKGECIELQGDRREFLEKHLKRHPNVVQR